MKTPANFPISSPAIIPMPNSFVNTSDQFEFDDFAEIDTALGSTDFNDSVNDTWTRNGGLVNSRDIDVFSSTIQNVPVINSTNESSFVTGILWDTSDGGAEYDGTQDLVFITIINESKAGQFGTYDYEIKIPATLRDYQAGTASVTFYTELK